MKQARCVCLTTPMLNTIFGGLCLLVLHQTGPLKQEIAWPQSKISVKCLTRLVNLCFLSVLRTKSSWLCCLCCTYKSMSLLLTLVYLFLDHCGESAGGCNVDECSSHYQRAIRRLEGAQEKDPSADLSMKRCRVSKKLHRCLHRIRRVCRGNLLYHSIKHIYDRDQRDFDCSKKPTIAPPSNFPSFGLVTVKTNISTATMTTTTSASPRDGDICRYTGTSPHKHCGMFGDPHLRTFSDVFNTCKVEGTWPLIDNDYMVVMVTNVPVKDGSSATVTTKVS